LKAAIVKAASEILLEVIRECIDKWPKPLCIKKKAVILNKLFRNLMFGLFFNVPINFVAMAFIHFEI